MGNCYGCKFAIEQRDHMRQGEQVRCAKAEELFGKELSGGKRWVDVRRSEATGKLLKAKCGVFEEITPADFQEAPKAMKACSTCKGSGLVTVRVANKSQRAECGKCFGKGVI